MEIYLAGTPADAKDLCLGDGPSPPFLLGSFYYMGGGSNKSHWKVEYLKRDECKKFMLDSGAFTFMEQASGNNTTEKVDFRAYLEKYIRFINEHDIDLFFELDIDDVVGLAKVREFRDILERETNRDCIPVWHRSRGKEAFIRLCKQYDYVAVGGLVGNEIHRSEYEVLHWLIDKAHEHGAKIHGLGFTPVDLDSYDFDSVDSKTWIYGGINGRIYQFKPGEGIDWVDQPDGTDRTDYKKFNRHNLRAWTQFSRYMASRSQG